jgi:hypothetical protein
MVHQKLNREKSLLGFCLEIVSRLAFIDANIRNSKKRGESIEDFKLSFTDQVIHNHPSTNANICEYCFEPLANILKEKSEQLEGFESFEFNVLFIMFEGYLDGFKQHKQQEPKNLVRAIHSVLETEEFEFIAECIKKEFINFSKNAKDSITWIIENPKHEKEQLDACKKVVDLIVKDPKNELKNNSSGALVRKFLDEVGLDKHGSHNIYRRNALKAVGIESPPLEFIKSINQIIILLEVLHYAGYENMGLPLKYPTYVDFRKIRN